MKPSLNKFFLFSSGFVAVFILFGFVLAQEIDKERAIEIVQTQGGPGGCNSETSCRAFCDSPDNFETCVSWARQNGLISGDEAERAEKFARQGRQFQGPGGCSSPEQCEQFCNQPQNHNICLDFAVQQGFLTSNEAERIKEFRRQAEEVRKEFEVETETDPEFDEDRARQILETQGGPGGCQTFDQCAQFCDQVQNQEVCFQFAERQGLFKNREAAEKIKKIISEGGPGGCRGERQCRAFCENPDNFETCIEFAEKHEFIKPEEVEKARRGARALKEGGPGGCHGPKECEAFCSNPANQETCFDWSKGHGFVSDEQIRMMEEFKLRRQKMEEEFRKRGEEFRPPEGFHQSQPPGEFLGPGGTPPPEYTPPIEAVCPKMPTVDSCPFGYRKEVALSSKECGTYYHCVSGGSTSPEYTPSSEYTPIYSPAPTYSPTPINEPYYEDPAARCTKEGGTWNSETKTCVFEKSGSILLNSGAYIKGAFRDFFFR